jgi:hypothetical protein
MIKAKKKFVCVQPKSTKARQLFEYPMLGLQSCEILNRTDDIYHLKPIRANFSFFLPIKGDDDWEIEK